MAQILRERYGIKLVAYIDDFGIIADSREEMLRDMEIFEAFCKRLGVCLAPWKTEGPTRNFTFLGLRVTNLPGCREIALPEDKRERLLEMIAEINRKHVPGARIDPRVIASLLGQLNFASQVHG